MIALDDSSNLQKAATQLNMSQPAASKLLKDLEEVLGVALFERLPRGMQPTTYGDSMVRYARMTIHHLNEAYEEVMAMKEGRVGHVRIGAIITPCMSLLPSVCAQIKEAYPNILISIYSDNSDVLMARLQSGDLDIVLGRVLTHVEHQNLRYRTIGEEAISVIARPEHPLLTQKKLRLSDLQSQAWIVPPIGTPLRQRFNRLFQDADLAIPHNLIETNSIVFTIKMLRESEMLAMISEDVAGDYAAHHLISVVPLPALIKMDAYGVITREDQMLSPAAQLVLKNIEEVFRAVAK